MEYKHIETEEKWRKHWEESKLYKIENNSDKPKYYVLDMFPYPSGAGLHVGHPLGYIASDIYARFKRLKGFNVLHPIGFDAFGLPAEEYALQTGIHPAVSTEQNMLRYKEQLNKLGFSFDWSREVCTCKPDYYKWTQWIFTQLFAHYYDNTANKALPISELISEFSKNGNTKVNAANEHPDEFTAAEWNAYSAKEQDAVLTNYRLAFRKIGYVNWCEELGTVLANDQVKDGVSERGGHPVEQKAMTQWYLRITAYAERLLNDLDTLDWSDALKAIQRNWIGRSEGASMSFAVADSDEHIEIFTTRPDTIFGATYMVLAPKHPLVEKLTHPDNKEAVETYVDYVSSKSELERMSNKEVTGTALGSFAINPFTQKKVPIWIAEYVLKDYGTGAIMAVPSDDERDNAFALKFGLEIIPVVDKSEFPDAGMSDKLGKMINSEFLNGLSVKEAIATMLQKMEELNLGKRRINYKLRDANFSRQRYWGEPFPVVYNEEDIPETLSLEQLPLALPDTDDFKPGQGGEAPLSRLKDWVELENNYSRETDVMPAVAGSSWYYLRYMDPNNPDEFAKKENIDYWQDVDLYVGGAEHAVAHLMYARFWHKFLFDKDLVPTTEPFKKLINQGMIQGVIEFLYMLKEKENGESVFHCAGIAKLNDGVEYVKIPIHVDYVTDYGSKDSYINKKGIDNFIAWRPAYKNAKFVCSKGTYQSGKFTPIADATESHFLTLSEVGKMSKSKFNVINPDHVVEEYGADCFRMYEMFLGPIEQSKPWDIQGIEGVSKFVKKYWRLFHNDDNSFNVSEEAVNEDELKVLHESIKKINADIEKFSFNTAVSQFMICVNKLRKLNCNKREILSPLNILLAPFAPYITEEIHAKLGHDDSVHTNTYPQHEEKYLTSSSIAVPLCVNGKKRSELSVSPDMSKEDLEAAAKEDAQIIKWTEGKEIVKVIVIPGKMVNVVVKA